MVKYTVMEEGYNNWSTLLRKYLQNEITPAEKEEMDRQMQSSPLKPRQFKERNDPEVFITDLKEVYYFDRKKARERLHAKLPFLQQPPVIPLFKQVYFRWMIAIAAAVITGIGVWKLLPVFTNSGLPIKSYSYVKLPNGTEVNLEGVCCNVPYNVAEYLIRYTSAGLVVELNEQATKKAIGQNYTVVTAAETKIMVRLSDASAVQLNAQSTLTAPIRFGNITRNVEFSGEGYFTIATNHDIPFVVTLNDKIAVIAEGTIFNIRNYENQEVATTLYEGAIKMKRGSDSILLKQGEQVQTINKRRFKTMKNPDIDQAVAWRKKDFCFTNMPIKDVMIEIGRWYGYDVEFCGAEIENTRASGKFERNVHIDSLIKVLVKTNPININKEENTLLISPK
jgi:ferric-dicitrate binding protein FerR (iron transport regulator)